MVASTRMCMGRLLKRLLTLIMAYCILVTGTMAQELPRSISTILAPSDIFLVTEEPHRLIFSQNADHLGVPASILKIPTALFALNTLGDAYHFPMDVCVTKEGGLYLKGYGDPFLTSEVLEMYARIVAQDLTSRGLSTLTGIGVDARYFDPVTIPGVTRASHQPYNAPNGALCANFNTVSYIRAPDGTAVSGEPQTPLLPAIARRIPPDLPRGRIRLSPEESHLYAGQLFGWFLQQHGITVSPSVGSRPYPIDEILYQRRLVSPYALSEVVEKLMAFSNNFMANQLFLATGAHILGPPATLEKSRRAFCNFMVHEIGACPKVVEGSGISRLNTISACTMDALLVRFDPHRDLLRQGPGLHFKTGTLEGVSTRAGYLTNPSGKKYRFVIMTHRKGGDAGMILETLERALSKDSGKK